jgi:hypothetical protein
MLWMSVTTHNSLCLQFNPRQKLNIILIILAHGTKLETGVTPLATLSKPTLADIGYILHANFSSTASRPPIKFVALMKATSLESSSAQSKGGHV